MGALGLLSLLYRFHAVHVLHVTRHLQLDPDANTAVAGPSSVVQIVKTEGTVELRHTSVAGTAENPAARKFQIACMLRGKSYLVTGSTDGIGRQTVTKLAASGADVLLHGR